MDNSQACAFTQIYITLEAIECIGFGKLEFASLGNGQSAAFTEFTSHVLKSIGFESYYTGRNAYLFQIKSIGECVLSDSGQACAFMQIYGALEGLECIASDRREFTSLGNGQSAAIIEFASHVLKSILCDCLYTGRNGYLFQINSTRECVLTDSGQACAFKPIYVALESLECIVSDRREFASLGKGQSAAIIEFASHVLKSIIIDYFYTCRNGYLFQKIATGEYVFTDSGQVCAFMQIYVALEGLECLIFDRREFASLGKGQSAAIIESYVRKSIFIDLCDTCWNG